MLGEPRSWVDRPCALLFIVSLLFIPLEPLFIDQMHASTRGSAVPSPGSPGVHLAPNMSYPVAPAVTPPRHQLRQKSCGRSDLPRDR